MRAIGERLQRAAVGGHVDLLAVAAVGFLAYANSFHSPFAFDDPECIANNPAVTRTGGWWPPLPMRWFATLTFTVNHRLGGLDPFGYHVVNFAVHVASALLVRRLASLVLRTPLFATGGGGEEGSASRWIPLLAALVFVAHPVQTQAVTYIAQRYASPATMLYLLSLVLFLRWRISLEPARRPPHVGGPEGRAAVSGGGRGLAACAGSVLAAVLAMKTKEIAFTLPFAAALCEALLFRGPAAARALRLLPLAATALVVPVNVLLVSHAAGLSASTRPPGTSPRCRAPTTS